MSSTAPSTLRIKNMVCPRCITVVRETLEDLGFTVQEVELGRAVVKGDTPVKPQLLNERLREHGFELLEDPDQQLTEQIKTLLIDYVRRLEENEEVPKVSDYLAGELHQNYSSLSALFSGQEETTIEKYLIHLKIERVKELLTYDELTLSEIAHRLNYSSVAHLSGQFKRVAGMSVTEYKQHRSRTPLDEM